MNLKTLLGISATALALGTAASAATVQITEGVRPRVIDTTAVNDPGAANPLSLGTVTATESSSVYGAIAPGLDVYTFDSTVEFAISWIFGGYDVDDGSGGTISTAVSGLRNGAPVTPADADKSAMFDLVSVGGLGGPVSVATGIFTADIIGGAANLFGDTFAAGSYELTIDGLGTTRAGLYDIEVAAFEAAAPVPLPASALLLLGAVGGLGFAARRKSA